MNDSVKTSIFAVVAAVLALGAFLSRPRQEVAPTEALKGKVLFPQFDDPAKAAKLDILRYDSDKGKTVGFTVARDKDSADAWTLPSQNKYPADAKDRMRDAALLLVDLRVLGVASAEKKDHKLFGVIAPEKDKTETGAEGLGDLVTFENRKSETLASLIIGKKRKGSEGQRFVRIPKEDVVYVVKIDPEKLSTKFQDWIEKDLLKLQSWDVENVLLRNYSVARVMNQFDVNMKFDLAAKQDNNEWKLQELTTYRDNSPTKSALAEGEELNKDKLNDLKDAAQKLEIIDVRRKPADLGADLKAGESFLKNRGSVDELVKLGFYPSRIGNGPVELLCANGEAHIGMKDGVEYVLRFGETLSGAGEEGAGQNRYLFVTTRVDMSKFPEPELQALPELPGAKKEEKKEAPKEAGKPVTEASKPAAEASKPGTEASKPAAEPAKPESKDEKKPAENTAAKPTAAEAAGEKAKTETTPTDSKPEAKPAEKPAAEAGKEAAKKDEAEPAKKEGEAKKEAPKTGDAGKEAAESDIAKERERITKENQKKIDERNEKLKKAKQRVAELNVRFASWFYVVPDKEYKKIFLDRSDLIKKSDKAKEEGDGVDAFRALQKDGLKK